jgi:hypothetical protein
VTDTVDEAVAVPSSPSMRWASSAGVEDDGLRHHLVARARLDRWPAGPATLDDRAAVGTAITAIAAISTRTGPSTGCRPFPTSSPSPSTSPSTPPALPARD